MHAHGQVVVVPARVCAWLERHADLQRIRTAARGQDAEVDAVLVAIAVASATWRTSATGSAVAPEPEVVAGSSWVSSSQAAGLLGITDRAVRLACDSGRLPAEKIDGLWRITREDVEHFRAARSAA